MTTVGCKYCGNDTDMDGTKLYNSCWELESRINDNPKLARKILKKNSKFKLPTFKNIWEWIRENILTFQMSAVIYFNIALAYLDITALSVEWWIVFVPVHILYSLDTLTQIRGKL